jgi:hypothetical protein
MQARNVCLSPTLMREVSTFVYESRPAFFDDPFFTREADPKVIAALEDPKRQEAMATSRAAQAYKKGLEVARAQRQGAACRRPPDRVGHRLGAAGALPGLLRAPGAGRAGAVGADPQDDRIGVDRGRRVGGRGWDRRRGDARGDRPGDSEVQTRRSRVPRPRSLRFCLPAGLATAAAAAAAEASAAAAAERAGIGLASFTVRLRPPKLWSCSCSMAR